MVAELVTYGWLWSIGGGVDRTPRFGAEGWSR
jgi:hypothetical protein